MNIYFTSSHRQLATGTTSFNCVMSSDGLSYVTPTFRFCRPHLVDEILKDLAVLPPEENCAFRKKEDNVLVTNHFSNTSLRPQLFLATFLNQPRVFLGQPWDTCECTIFFFCKNHCNHVNKKNK